MLKKISFLGLLTVVAACSSAPSPQVQAMQKKDKQLTCKEVLLEMNEAQFYQKMAQKNKGPNLKNILMPLGYISTYVSAEDAIEAASARVDYLDKIYGIMDCESQKNNMQSQASYYPMPGGGGAQYMGTNYAPDPRMAGAGSMPVGMPVGQVQQRPVTAPSSRYMDEQQASGMSSAQQSAQQRMY
jgi:hypothetical protein